MTPWILAVLGLWLAQVFFAAGFRTVLADDAVGATMDHMRAKDDAPELSKMGGRAVRAQTNLSESLPIFLALALLLEIKGAPGLAVTGAITFLVGRVLYVPAYMVGVFGLRTAMWAIGLVGLGMMAWAAL
jgi:uncharacterized MAPEG superfamily protein